MHRAELPDGVVSPATDPRTVPGRADGGLRRHLFERWHGRGRWLRRSPGRPSAPVHLVLAVLALHAWVLAGLWPAPPPIAPQAPMTPWAPMVLVTRPAPHLAHKQGAAPMRVVAADAAAKAAPAADAAEAAPAATGGLAAEAPAARAVLRRAAPAQAKPQVAAAAGVDSLPQGLPRGLPIDVPSGLAQGPPHPGPPGLPARLPQAASLDDAPAADLAAAALSAAVPPPRYATRLPPDARATYRLDYLGRASTLSLLWQRQGERYQLLLDTAQPGAHPVMAQHSDGEIDADGLAPTRFVDRRRGRAARAANFRRDQAVVSFSAGPALLPAWPGAQDRLSWLIQLAGVVQAAADAGQALAEVRLWVVDARGGGSLWRLVDDGERRLAMPLGERLGRCWRHDAEPADGLRVEVCLDAARHHWPLRLRYTLLRNGAVIEWLLQDEPQPP